MNFKIGIFGSSAGNDTSNKNILEKARILGKELGKRKLTVINGACSGLPYQVCFNAAKNGATVIGYSPELDLLGQKKFCPTDDLSIYKEIIYTPKSFAFSKNNLVNKKYRNVISTANCDGGIIISGRWGTMNEFTNLYDMKKVIGVLTGTGGIADEIKRLNKKIKKDTEAKIFFSNSPQRLIELIIDELNKRKN